MAAMAIENASEDVSLENRKFKVLLNGVRDLQLQLEEFKKACDSHEKHRRKRHKRRYYHLGLMARIVSETTDDEMRRLLKHGTRTFLFDAVTNKRDELDTIVKRTKASISDYQNNELSVRIVIGLALELHGDCCRIGRMRNNCSVLLSRGLVMTLTTDDAYRYSCFREIAYVINLKYYLKTLKLQDEILIGSEVRARVVKCLKSNIAIAIEESGIVNSYEYIELPNQCYSLKKEVLPEFFQDDLQLSAELGVDFIVIPKIRCKLFLKALSSNLTDQKYNFKSIGFVDLAFVSSKMLDLTSIIKLIDYLWIPDMFMTTPSIATYIFDNVIPIAKCLKKPIIGSVPLERCSDFKLFENNEFLWKIDVIFIEKSPWCNKYPLIVKKLLPIIDFRMGVVDNCLALKSILTSYQSIVNFIIRTISSIECQAIFLYSKCEMAAVALGRVEIYCPVFMILPLDDEEAEHSCKINLARTLNLRRNLRPILYTKEMNECDLKPVEFAIEYARKVGCLETGDFLMTLEVCKEDEENIEYGLDEDVVILRAFYLPPIKVGEKFKCS